MIYMKKNNYYNCIYMYINKLNGRKYIGQAQDFNKRHRHHIAKSTNKYPIDRAFNKYGKENFEIKILAENIPTQEQMNEYEKFFIKRYKILATECGYNISNGGESGHNNFAGKTEEEINEIKHKISIHHADISGKNNPMYCKCGKDNPNYDSKRSNKSIEKRRETVLKNGTYKEKNNPFYGKHHTEETKKIMSEKAKGRKISEETKKKMSKSQKGKGTKKIAQYDKNMNLIKIWNSGTEIIDELHLSSQGNIISCCKGKLKTAYGFIWRYYE